MTTLLETRGLKKHFGGAHVINGIDFRIEANEIRCVIGPNGAGKSTFFKLITGEHRPSEGSVMFLGKDMSHEAVAEYTVARHIMVKHAPRAAHDSFRPS